MNNLQLEKSPKRNVIYVNGGNTNSVRDGTSWDKAYDNLQSALDEAATKSPSDIWISQGVYVPSKIYSPYGKEGGSYGEADPHLATFNIPNDTALYGGFNGTEKHLCERDTKCNRTVLSGANFMWHVVIVGNDIIPHDPVNVILDSLTVREGNARGPSNGTLIDAYFQYNHSNGGGVYVVFGSSLVTKNVSIEENIANDRGGGLFSHNSNLVSLDSTFEGNVANTAAGGLCYATTYTESKYKSSVSRATFYNNRTTNFGGAAVVEGISASYESEAEFLKCEFRKNSSLIGGAVAVDCLKATLNDCVLRENLAYVSGGALSTTNVIMLAIVKPPGETSPQTTVATNCSFYKNTTQGNTFLRNLVLDGKFEFLFPLGGGAAVSYLGGRLLIDHCVLEENEAISSNGGAILNGKASGVISFSTDNSFIYEASTSVNNSDFIKNSAYNGGAVASEPEVEGEVDCKKLFLYIKDSCFLENKARVYGGAVFASRSDVTLLCNRYKKNKAGVSGNNVYIAESCIDDKPTPLYIRDGSK